MKGAMMLLFLFLGGMMKIITYLILCFGSLTGSVFAQVTMKINGDPVGSGDVYQYVAEEPPGSIGAEQMILEIHNVSNDVMEFTVERCKIVDVPGWEVSSTVWAGSDDPFGGIHYNNSTMTGECWTTLHSVESVAGSFAQLGDYMNSTDVSCCLYRYYIWNGSNLEDSVDVEFCRTEIVGLNYLDEIHVSVFPNPVDSELFIHAGNEVVGLVEIMSLSGKVMLSKKGDSVVNVSVEDIPNGVYILRLQIQNGEWLRERLVIAH